EGQRGAAEGKQIAGDEREGRPALQVGGTAAEGEQQPQRCRQAESAPEEGVRRRHLDADVAKTAPEGDEGGARQGGGVIMEEGGIPGAHVPPRPHLGEPRQGGRARSRRARGPLSGEGRSQSAGAKLPPRADE